MIQDIDITDLRRITTLVHSKYGYDFRDYAMSSFKRRMIRILELKNMTVDELLGKLSDGRAFIEEFLDEVTVNTTELFRDPGFWRSLREEIIPAILINNKEFRVLHAGCSSGEEVLSMSILLKEMGIADNVALTATDLDAIILARAQGAAYSLKSMELNEKNYLRFEGIRKLQDYYKVDNGKAVFNRELLKNVTFRKYDLVTGDVFNKFDLILCRNVMIYFNQTLQNEVVKKFHASLFRYGYLAIGSKESIAWCEFANRFIVVNQEEKIYRKVRD